jgi:hypothetical protein
MDENMTAWNKRNRTLTVILTSRSFLQWYNGFASGALINLGGIDRNSWARWFKSRLKIQLHDPIAADVPQWNCS